MLRAVGTQIPLLLGLRNPVRRILSLLCIMHLLLLNRSWLSRCERMDHRRFSESSLNLGQSYQTDSPIDLEFLVPVPGLANPELPLPP